MQITLYLLYKNYKYITTFMTISIIILYYTNIQNLDTGIINTVFAKKKMQTKENIMNNASSSNCSTNPQNLILCKNPDINCASIEPCTTKANPTPCAMIFGLCKSGNPPNDCGPGVPSAQTCNPNGNQNP